MAFVGAFGGVPSSRGCRQVESVRRTVRVVAVAKNVSSRRRKSRDDNELVGRVESDGWSRHSTSSSRFPANLDEALLQVRDATQTAIDCGEMRLVVDFLPKAPQSKVLEAVLAPMLAKGLRVVVFCDTVADLMRARAELPHYVASRVLLSSLGNREDLTDCDIAVMLQPNNVDHEPRKIEEVEWVHYRLIWKEERPVVLINPKLMSLGSGLDAHGNVRKPMFMQDFICAYHLDPCVFQDENIRGGLLHHYPRKWEMYLYRPKAGYRLVAQHNKKPTREAILVQYLWRSDLARARVNDSRKQNL